VVAPSERLSIRSATVRALAALVLILGAVVIASTVQRPAGPPTQVALWEKVPEAGETTRVDAVGRAATRAPQPVTPSAARTSSSSALAAPTRIPTGAPTVAPAPPSVAVPTSARTATPTQAQVAPPTASPTAAATPQPVSTLPAFDTAMNGVLAQGYPGGSLAIIRDGKLVYARGYGLAKDGVPATSDTRYRQASVSKAVTRSLLAKLVASGSLSLDTPVYAFLGVTPSDTRANSITVRMLRDHTSGLAADHFLFDSRKAATFYGVPSPPDADTMVRWTARQALAAEPGSAYRYNNTNYALLTRVIERATGRAWIDLVSEMVRPIGVATWRMGPSLARPADEARYLEAEQWRYGPSVFDSAPGTVEAPYGTYDAVVLGGATALVSTVVDMARYGQGVSTGAIPAPEAAPIPTKPGWNYTYIYNGSMPGHYTFVIRIWDGTNLTVLAGAFNHRDAGPIDDSINQRMLDAYAATKTWPTVDLF
jgi:N-acyl-D-amino-acid deacylase